MYANKITYDNNRRCCYLHGGSTVEEITGIARLGVDGKILKEAERNPIGFRRWDE